MSFRSFCSALFCGLVFCHVAEAQINFEFPAEDVPVLRVDEYYSEANKAKRPMLLVYSDGRVVRPVSDQEADDYQFTLSEEKFQSVLNEIFTTNSFLTVSDETILEEVSRGRKKRPSSTSFRVTANTTAGAHVVNFGNSWLHDRLGLGRERYLDSDHLQRFLDVEESCRTVSNLALMGGEEAFEAITEQANAKFKEAYPDGPEISDANLASVRLNQEGKIAIRFTVPKNVVDPQPVSVWVTKTKGEDELEIELKVFKPFNIHG